MSEKKPLGEAAALAAERNRTRWTAPELLAAEFPEPRWAVPKIVPEGLTFLGGAPKVGKSWLGLALAVAVASGGFFLDEPVERGDVLYCALEDPGRRLQQRLRIVLESDPPPEQLTLETQAGRGDEALGLITE
jgi:RecA-family ATPase